MVRVSRGCFGLWWCGCLCVLVVELRCGCGGLGCGRLRLIAGWWWLIGGSRGVVLRGARWCCNCGLVWGMVVAAAVRGVLIGGVGVVRVSGIDG